MTFYFLPLYSASTCYTIEIAAVSLSGQCVTWSSKRERRRIRIFWMDFVFYPNNANITQSYGRTFLFIQGSYQCDTGLDHDCVDLSMYTKVTCTTLQQACTRFTLFCAFLPTDFNALRPRQHCRRFARNIFKNIFFNPSYHIWVKIHRNLFSRFNKWFVSIGSDNGLASFPRQAIIWTNNGPI